MSQYLLHVFCNYENSVIFLIYMLLVFLLIKLVSDPSFTRRARQAAAFVFPFVSMHYHNDKKTNI